MSYLENSDEYDMSDLFDKKKRHKDLISRLDEMDSDNYTTDTGYSASSFLPSSMLKEPKKKKEKKEEDPNGFHYDPDAWFDEMLGYQDKKVRKKAGRNILFDSAGITEKKKKKKKKKDKENTFIDYKREFSPESMLYKNLWVEQRNFTESLQKEYDNMKSTKSSSRGVTKQMTDLIENINGARQLQMQLIDKQVAIKKQAAELNMKQKKEFGADNGDSENMSDFASSYLKQMFNERQTLFNGGEGDATITEYSDDELYDELSTNLDKLVSESEDESEDEQRSKDAEILLFYENKNVEIKVVIHNDNIETYDFVAMLDGIDPIPTYPLPQKTKISVNRSTNIATDAYGQKYRIMWD